MAEKFEAVYGGEDPDLMPRYNIAPTQPVLVVRAKDGRREISSMRWGLIPSWAKDVSAAQINARSETLLEKPAFRESFERRRCLIPADGFYEWKRTGSTKQPFHFGMKDDSLFAFAGIWDRWRQPRGLEIESCAIVTTTPNDLLSDVHHRMPAILRPEHYDTWLTAPILEIQRHIELFRPVESALMKRIVVSSFVNDPQNDSPECVKETSEAVSLQAELFG
jgi:putative SOS response-associated peptidase YedK